MNDPIALGSKPFVWDVLAPTPLGWTPLFNAQAQYQKDAVLYITPTSAIAGMGLGSGYGRKTVRWS